MSYFFVKKEKGFTLIEMLLVLVIMSFILVALIGYTQQRTESMRRDRTALQIQQIENAAMAYYIANGSWPADVAELQTTGFIPNITIANPYGGNPYILNGSTDTGNLNVCTSIVMGTPESATATAQIISGRVPMGIITDTAAASCSGAMTPATSCSAASCTVRSSINIPGQNLNNARSVNFSGVYRHGGCVPVPSCPGPTTGTNQMNPDIVAVPLSVSGFNDPGNAIVYPINSFTAYPTQNTPLDGSPPACTSAHTPVTPPPCPAAGTPGASPTGLYWRVCLQVITGKGDVSESNPNWGNEVSILAITRCVPSGEPSGSDYSTYQQY